MKDVISSRINSKRELMKSNIDKDIDDFISRLEWVEKDNPKLFKLIQFILDHSPAFVDEQKINGDLYLKNQDFFLEVIPNLRHKNPYFLMEDLLCFIVLITDDMEYSVKWCKDIPQAFNKKEKTIEVHPPSKHAPPDKDIYPVLFEDCASGIGRQNPDYFFEALQYNKDAIEYESSFDKILKKLKDKKQQEMEP